MSKPRRKPWRVSPAPPDTADAPASIVDAVLAVKHPAYGLDRLWNACAWNKAAKHLFPIWLGPERQRNLLIFVFLDPAAHDLIPHWQDRAVRLLAEFRSDFGHSFSDPRARDLVERLQRESPLFAKTWNTHSVLEREGGLRTFHGPGNGLLRFVQSTFHPSERPDYKLVILTPA